MNKKIEQLLNKQIQKEFNSAYLYLSMKEYLETIDLEGFAHFFYMQAKEEVEHAMRISDYINQKGGRVELEALDKPTLKFDSPLDVFEKALEHEKYITRSIYDILEVSMDEKDHSSVAFLQWFVVEQDEEEESMATIIAKLEQVGIEGPGLFMMDQQLGKRE